jgi:hypothetical protein
MKGTRLVAAVVLTIGLMAAPGYAGTESEATVAQVTAAAGGPSRAALTAALDAYSRAQRMGAVARTGLLTLIDYTRPSVEPRLWVIDLRSGQTLYRELVAHGRGSGDNMATAFSNDPESHMSSLGLFVTGDTYVGHNGYSLRLQGLDPGLNDHALSRAIVMHGAAYVNDAVGRQLGRLGRSWGCPAVPLPVAHALIDTLKGGTVVFAYGPGLDSTHTS